jgi:hypothetical protein
MQKSLFKKMKNSIKILSITALASLMIMSKCGKDKPQIDDETQTIEDNIISEQEFMRIVPVTNDKAIKQKGIGSSGKILNGGPTVLFRAWDRTLVGNASGGWNTVTTANALTYIDSAKQEFKTDIDCVKIVLTYGQVGVPPVQGQTNVTGKVITVMIREGSKPFKLFGSDDAKFDAYLKDYEVDGVKYNGLISVFRKNKTEMKIKVKGGKTSKLGWAQDVNFDNEGERKIKWTKGANHPSNNSGATYDEYEITDEDSNGKGCKGKSRDGLTYESKITKPLIYRTDAKYGIVDGEVELTPLGKKTRIINYSQINQGIVTFTVDGNTFTIRLQ